MHRQPRVRNEKAHEIVTTGSPKRSGIPCAMVLTAYSALSRVTGLSCHPRLPIISAGLMPASGHQDHTTSPSAKVIARLRACNCTSRPILRVHCIPHPTFVTIANAPLDRVQDGANHTPDLGFGKTEIFFSKGLDSISRNLPVGQISSGLRMRHRSEIPGAKRHGTSAPVRPPARAM
jgi:hypothetical protein